MPNSACDLPIAQALPPFVTLPGVACQPGTAPAFYPERGERTDTAKAICGLCPHVEACLRWALDTDQRYGVWGGLSADERAQLKPSRLGPGRPKRTAQPGDSRTGWNHGENNGRHKLNPEKVREIRAGRAAGELQATLARRYGISVTTVQNILNGKLWRAA